MTRRTRHSVLCYKVTTSTAVVDLAHFSQGGAGVLTGGVQGGCKNSSGRGEKEITRGEALKLGGEGEGEGSSSKVG